MESPFPALPFALGSRAGAAGWKDAHQAVQNGSLAVDQTQYQYAEDRLKVYAATQAKRYMQQIVERLSLTPRQGVNMFAVYMHAYLNGALDEAARHAGQNRE
jgi:hypothetical protein